MDTPTSASASAGTSTPGTDSSVLHTTSGEAPPDLFAWLLLNPEEPTGSSTCSKPNPAKPNETLELLQSMADPLDILTSNVPADPFGMTANVPSTVKIRPKTKKKLVAKSAPTKLQVTKPSTTKKEENPEEDVNEAKRMSRLERNRISARECRRKKQNHINRMQERIAVLERENLELQSQMKQGAEARRQEEEEKFIICRDLEEMLKSGASEDRLAEKIRAFKEEHADYGYGRRVALKYHLHQLERLLLPTQVTKMCMWAIQQDDSFWSEEDDMSLASILTNELGISEEQKTKIKSHRSTIQQLCKDLHRALLLVQELKDHSTNKNQSLDSEMDQIQSILTPSQTTKFILWVTKNPACMHMLNQLWKNPGS